jgi:uncharacterized protein (TIGR02246 family)
MPTDQAAATLVHRRPLSEAEAQATTPLAERWLDAWNTHDTDRIVALYAPDARHTSARVKALGGANDTLHGLEAIRDYFHRGLAKYPALKFDPISVSTGPRTVAIEYMRHGVEETEPTLELLETDESGLILHSRVYHR